MPDPKKQPRDKNQPLPKDPPKSSFKAKVAKLLFVVALFLVTATMVAYSLRIERWPWAWTGDDWKGYATFSQEKAKAATDEIKAIDWSKFGEKTKQLWNDAPNEIKKIEDRLSGSGKPAASTTKPGETPSAAPTDVTASHKQALETMREGIGHYRKSPDDAGELKAAKKSFEDAAGLFEKALKETNDDKTKGEIKKDLETCNKYLEDCRAREKS